MREGWVLWKKARARAGAADSLARGYRLGYVPLLMFIRHSMQLREQRRTSPLPSCSAMPLIYSLVSRSIHVLAEYTSSGLTGNFSTVSRVLLKVR
jgi:hypothetical protein